MPWLHVRMVTVTLKKLLSGPRHCPGAVMALAAAHRCGAGRDRRHVLFTAGVTRRLCSPPQDTLNNNSLGKKHSWQERVSRSSSPLKTGELSESRPLHSFVAPRSQSLSQGLKQALVGKCPRWAHVQLESGASLSVGTPTLLFSPQVSRPLPMTTFA